MNHTAQLAIATGFCLGLLIGAVGFTDAVIRRWKTFDPIEKLLAGGTLLSFYVILSGIFILIIN